MKLLKLIVSGLLLAVVGLLMAVAQSNPPASASGDKAGNPPKELAKKNQTPDNQVSGSIPMPSGNQAGPKGGLNESDKESAWKDPIVWFTGALVIVGAAQFYVYWRQKEIMNESLAETRKAAEAASASVAAAKDTAQKQLRAYLSIEPFFMVSFSAGQRAGVRVKITNFGQTPAYEVRTRGDVILRPEQPGTEFPVPQIIGEWGVKSVVFPNSHMEEQSKGHTHIGAKNLFTAAEITQIQNRTLTIYVLSEVQYRDIYGEQYKTACCKAVAADVANMTGLTTAYAGEDLKVGFLTAPVGNTAT